MLNQKLIARAALHLSYLLWLYTCSYYYYVFIVPLPLYLGCGHCKSLAPVYEEVGAAFSREDEVRDSRSASYL